MKKIIVSFFVRTLFLLPVFCLSFLFLIQVEQCDLSEAIRIPLGARPLGLISYKGACFLFLAALQYINAEFILFWIDRNGTLRIRYRDFKQMFLRMFWSILFANLSFVFMFFIAAAVAGQLTGNNLFSLFTGVPFLILSLHMTAQCMILSGFQLISLIKTSETNTFLFLTAYLLIVISLSCMKPGKYILYFVPWNRETTGSILCAMLSCLTAAAVWIAAEQIFKKSEVLEK